MKKLLPSITALVLLLALATGAKAQNVNIPDATLKGYLVWFLSLDTDWDGEISVAEAAAYTGVIDCTDRGITNVTGIEAFINVFGLYFSNNNLTSVDVSKNTKLEILYLDNNKLTSLDVSKNPQLSILICRNNQLTSLNVKNGGNTHLQYMQAETNPNLSCIQVDNVANANAYANWWKDETASYSTDCNAVLPVTLVSFMAKADGNYAKLQWQTADEVNNRQFIVYRSSTNEKFVKTGEVQATFNSPLSTFNYSYTDKNPLNGINYYKLVQIDNDGKENELGVRTVNFGHLTSDIRLSPNPARTQSQAIQQSI